MKKFLNIIFRIIISLLVGYMLLIVWGVLNFTDGEPSPVYIYGLWLIPIICLYVFFYQRIQAAQDKIPELVKYKVSRFVTLSGYAFVITMAGAVSIIIILDFLGL